MLDIFALEITALDAELLQLQAMLESKRNEQSLLKELRLEANSALGLISKLKEKLAGSDAIASLKSAVLNLFTDDDGGNQPTDPTPDPEPTNSGGIEQNHAEDDESTTGDLQEEDSQEEAESEDSGEEELIFHPGNSAIAWIASEAEDGKLTAFIGFGSKSIAKSWQKFIDSMALSTEIGGAAVMEGYKCELRCYGLSMGQITRLAQQDFTKGFLTEVEDIGIAKPPEPQRKFAECDIRVGDKVTRLLTPSELFEVTTPVVRGDFFAKSTLTGDRQLFSIEDVDIVSRLPKVQYAKVLLPNDEFYGQKLPIFDQSKDYLKLKVLSGDIIAYKRDVVEICDEEIESMAEPTDPMEPTQSTERIHPVTQRPNLVQPAFGGAPGGLADTHSILSVGDIVQIESDRYAQYVGHVGTVIEIVPNSSLPICVKAPRGVKPYHRSDLKLVTKASTEPVKELVAAGQEFEF